ncbi:MAG: hypothetical protein QXH91_05605 [Candidatus Bathyarchaeia archaeon]
MTEETTVYHDKIKKAARMLFFQKYRKPGMKGWELRRALGKNYLKIIDLLNLELEKLGLRVNIVSDDGTPKDKLTEGQKEKAWFFITFTEGLTPDDVEMSGWRIDDLAVLAVAISYITSKQGKALRADIERILKQKLPEWRVTINLDRFIKMGYLSQDENRVLHIGWRTRAEIDQKALLELVISEDAIKSQQIPNTV